MYDKCNRRKTLSSISTLQLSLSTADTLSSQLHRRLHRGGRRGETDCAQYDNTQLFNFSNIHKNREGSYEEIHAEFNVMQKTKTIYVI